MALARDGKLTTAFPELGTDPVPADIYWRPEWYEKECGAIFARTWLHLASAHEIPKPGDFVVKEIPTFDYKIILVRGKDGNIRAFQNVCTHRGSEVELRDKGRCKVFTCPFHGWSFNTEGKLVGVPGADDFFDLDREQKGLRQVHADVWEHHVFVNLAETPDESLLEFLGEFGRDLTGWPAWERCSVSWEYKAHVKVNWKLLLDAFNEIYHAPIIHKHSVKAMFITPDNPNGEILGVTRKGPHRGYSAPGNHRYQPKPGQGLGYRYASGQTVTSAGGAGDNDFLPKGINEGRSPTWSFDQPTFFPNWALIITPQTYFAHQVWPLGPGESIWRMRMYMPPAQSAAQRFGQEHANVELRDTVMEDANTFERVQHSLEKGLVSHFTFHDHEVACRMQYHIVKEWVERWEKSRETPPAR